MLGDRAGQELRLGDLFPADRLFAAGLDDGLHPFDEVNVIGLADGLGFIPADVDIRPRRQRSQFADDVLQEGVGDILAGAQRNLRAGYAGVEIRRDPVAVQFGVGSQGGIPCGRAYRSPGSR